MVSRSAGNMTFAPRPSGEAQGEGLDMVYDAWNRLVAVYGRVSDGLAGYWKFDDGEGTTATDSSGTGADGTLLPAGSEPVWTGDGRCGGALEFDGINDGVSLAADDALNTSYTTVMFWMKASDAAPATGQTLFNRRNTNPGTIAFYYGSSTSYKVQGQIRLDGSEGTARCVRADSAVTTDWTHVALIYDGSTLKMYINGVLQSQTLQISGALDTDSFTSIFIGRHETVGEYFHGLIDNVRVYDRALSADEIASMGLTTYQYDGANRRTIKTLADGSSVEYYYNRQWQVLEERAFDDEGAPVETHSYVWSARYVDAPVLRDTYDYDAQEEEYVLDAAARVYYAGDANYNVTALLDYTGAVVERYVYTPYGEATVYDGNWSNPAAATGDGPLYCGYWFDAETGAYHVRAREYHPTLGAFTARDPLGFSAGDPNLYAYCGGNPLARTDPSGRLVVRPTSLLEGGFFGCPFPHTDPLDPNGFYVALPGGGEPVWFPQWAIIVAPITEPEWCEICGPYEGGYGYYNPWTEMWYLTYSTGHFIGPHGWSYSPGPSTERRLWVDCGHLYMELETYDKWGYKTGSVDLHFGPNGYLKVPHESAPWLIMIYSWESNAREDARLIEKWHELQEDYPYNTPYNFFGWQCWTVPLHYFNEDIENNYPDVGTWMTEMVGGPLWNADIFANGFLFGSDLQNHLTDAISE